MKGTEGPFPTSIDCVVNPVRTWRCEFTKETRDSHILMTYLIGTDPNGTVMPKSLSRHELRAAYVSGLSD